MPARYCCRFLIAATMLVAALAWAGTTSRVSVSSTGVQADGQSDQPALSADGRYVAFASDATNLVLGDTNGCRDVFVRDRTTGVTTRVSVASDGAQANGHSYLPALSADGRYVAFVSGASNLDGGTSGYWDVFVHDRVTGQTSRVSVSSSGIGSDSISRAPSISADGRYVAFLSEATTLVPDDTNAKMDVFVRDRLLGQTSRVSVSNSGAQGDGHCWSTSISADGRYVAFISDAGNLVPGDQNSATDAFRHDRLTGRTILVSVYDDGGQISMATRFCSMTSDGRYILSYFVDTIGNPNSSVRDCALGKTCYCPTGHCSTISGNGRYIVYSARGWNWNVTYVYDRVANVERRVDVATNGRVATDRTSWSGDSPAITADGRFVAFGSGATDLVSGDTNAAADIFVHDLRSPSPPDFPLALIRANLHTHSHDSAGDWILFDHNDSPAYQDLLSQAFSFGLHCIGVSDHAEAVTQQEWDNGVALCKPYTSGPIALHGFEWTPEPAKDHINVFGTTTKARANDDGEGNAHGDKVDTVQGMYRWLADATSLYGTNAPVVAQFNHIAYGDSHFEDFAPYGAIDGGMHDPRDVITLAELAITSPVTPGMVQPADTLAFNIYNGEKYWRQALAKGWKLAPTLGNDNGRDLTSSARRFHSGIYLQGVTTSRLAVLQALAARRTFASQDADAEIQLWQDTRFMGSSLGNVAPRTPFTLCYVDPTDASTRANLKTAVAVLNGTETALPLTTSRVNGWWTWKIVGPKSRKLGGYYVYVRLRQRDGDYVFSAPIWFNVNPATAPALSLASVTASATGTGGAQISYSLSAPANVSVRLTNIAGRALRILPDAAGKQGLNTLLWDGKSADGLPVPSGRYLVQLVARDDTGGQCQGMAACSIQRR
jgi:Tol biopolymer transport system component